MTDDRLRRAAARLAGTEDGYWPADITIWFATTGSDSREIDASPLAELLLDIAAEAVCTCLPDWTERGLRQPGCPAHDVMIDSLGSALELADEILKERA